MQIIPVLNCLDRAEAEGKIAVAEKFLKHGDFLHVDIADGVFTFHKTWNDPAGWAALRSPFPLEVHLMVEHPEAWIAPWLAAGAKRFVVPIEAIDEDSLRNIPPRARRVAQSSRCPQIRKPPSRNLRRICTTFPGFRFSR